MIMNKILKLIGCLSLLVMMASCSEDTEFYTLETPVDQMLLKPSVQDLVLDRAIEDETAISFTWNEAAKRGEDGAITTYSFRLYMAEMPSNVTELYQIPDGQRSFQFTHRELNDLLASWNIHPGDKVTLEAEVIAQIHSSVHYLKPELSKAKFDVTGYIKSLSAIYLVTVAQDGSRVTQRVAEKQVGSSIYYATVNWKPCSYFFATDAESDYPCYMKGETGENSLQMVSEEGSGEMLVNSLTGTYTIVVDLNELDVNSYKIYELPSDGIWIVGDATDIGWDWGKMQSEGKFKNDDLRHPEQWTYTGTFYADKEFKLSLEPQTGNFAGKFFFAPVADANPQENHLLKEARYQENGGDLKWRTKSTEGQYTLVVDLHKMEIHLNPAE